MSADLAIQKAIRARLASTAAVTDLVPATSILDRNERPAPDPSIILGEDQMTEGDDIGRRQVRIYSTLHVWKKQNGLVGVKAIAWAIRQALHAARLELDNGFHAADVRVSGSRFLRDPDGEHSHAVVTVESYVQERVS